MQKKEKGSGLYLTASLLTLAGGFLDAYTYFSRGKVFANAQTGNIIKLGIAAAEGNYGKMIDFLMPITAFCAGILVVLVIEHQFGKRNIRYVHRAVLAAEILALCVTAFLPMQEVTNVLCNIIVSFVCAMQMEGFKSFLGQPIATTVSTGNLRKCIEYFYKGIVGNDPEDRITGLKYLMIVFLFISGVFIGTLSVEYFGIRASLIPAGLLALAYIIITIRYRQIIAAEKAAA